MRRSTLAICALLTVAIYGCDTVDKVTAKLKLAWDKVRGKPTATPRPRRSTHAPTPAPAPPPRPRRGPRVGAPRPPPAPRTSGRTPAPSIAGGRGEGFPRGGAPGRRAAPRTEPAGP